MGDHSLPDEPTEVLVPIEEALPGMRLVNLPVGETWVGALILIKTRNREDSSTWSVRRTDGLSNEELLGMVSVQVEMLHEKIRQDNEE